MQRLTPEDQVMLWPDQLWPQAIGMVAILDGAALLDPGGRVRIEAVRATIEARLHLVPRLQMAEPTEPRQQPAHGQCRRGFHAQDVVFGAQGVAGPLKGRKPFANAR